MASALILLTLCVWTIKSTANRVYAADKARAPNIVLLMADDLGWGDVGFNGAKLSLTPHLDAMARESLKLERFYAAAPVCSPTRGSVLTGRHPHRYGIPTANAGHMKTEEFTLAEALRTRGYATGHFGKWHLGTLTTKVHDANRGKPNNTKDYTTPAMNGFDTYFSTESKVPTWDPLRAPKKFGVGESLHYGWIPVEDDANAEHYGTRYWEGKEQEVKDDLRGDDSRLIINRALPFMAKAVEKEQPFFAVIWFHTPHLPVVTGKEYRDRFPELSLKEQLYFGAINAMDESIGRLRSELREMGVAENTLLWFASDNGPENGTPGSAGPYRGRKRSLYEGGVRVPALVEWPGHITAGQTSNVAAATSDIFPTVLAALGIRRSEEQVIPIDGVNLLPLFEGAMTERPQPLGFQYGSMSTWHDGTLKLVHSGGKKATLELYDLETDPAETRNIADQHPQVVKKMRQALLQWQASCEKSASGADYD